MKLKITVLGSGTSSGVPTIGCSCAVCRSTDPRDNRLRPSVLIQHAGRNIVIDTTPDFRTQVLRAGIEHLDAIVYTHSHADHVLGLDDVRPFNYRQNSHIPIYATAPTFEVIGRIFEYAFANRKHVSTVPKLDVNIIGTEPFEVAGLTFEPIPVIHGNTPVVGFRIGNVAYLTDHNELPESSLAKLQGLDVLFLDALRHKPHPTHSTVAASVEIAQRLGAKRTYFTHMCHDLGHEETQRALPAGIFLAYDGLEIEVGGTVVAIGNFDGVHAGHQEILKRVVATAAAEDLTPAVLTFEPHPAKVLAPERAPSLITTAAQRLRRLKAAGVETVRVTPFTPEFAALSPEEFAKRVLRDELSAKVVMVGEDFRFGYRQAGDIGTLREMGARLGFRVEPVGQIGGARLGGARVSSTAIRKLVVEGKVSRACRLMGAPFALEGPVVAGQGIGRTQTVPTLNLAPENELLPRHGVYATRTRIAGRDGLLASITNVGVRPTFAGEGVTVETFLLAPMPEGVSAEAGSRIEVEFLAFIRAERKFESPEALKRQIVRDVARARRVHAKTHVG